MCREMEKKKEKSELKTKWIWENDLVLKIWYDKENDKTIIEYYKVNIKGFCTELIPQFKWGEVPWNCVEWFNFKTKY